MSTTTTATNVINLSDEDMDFIDIEKIMRTREAKSNIQRVKELDSIDYRAEKRRLVYKAKKEKEMHKVCNLVAAIFIIAGMGLCALTAVVCAAIIKMDLYSYIIAGCVTAFVGLCTLIPTCFYIQRKIKSTFNIAINAYDRAQ